MKIALGGKVKDFAAGRYLKTSPKTRVWSCGAAVASGTLLLAPLAIADSYTVIEVTKNQDYCGESIPNPVYVVGKDGGLQNVEVFLKDVTAGRAPTTDPIAISLV